MRHGLPPQSHCDQLTESFLKHLSLQLPPRQLHSSSLKTRTPDVVETRRVTGSSDTPKGGAAITHMTCTRSLGVPFCIGNKFLTTVPKRSIPVSWVPVPCVPGRCTTVRAGQQPRGTHLTFRPTEQAALRCILAANLLNGIQGIGKKKKHENWSSLDNFVHPLRTPAKLLQRQVERH